MTFQSIFRQSLGVPGVDAIDVGLDSECFHRFPGHFGKQFWFHFLFHAANLLECLVYEASDTVFYGTNYSISPVGHCRSQSRDSLNVGICTDVKYRRNP